LQFCPSIFLSAPLHRSGRVPRVGGVEGTVTYQADRGAAVEVCAVLRQAGQERASWPRRWWPCGPSRSPIRARPAETVTIDQQNFQFTPETVVIRRGDSVRFTNADATTHNVQSSSEIATFNVNMPGGGEQTIKFDKAGGTRQPVQVGCVFHSAMRAFIFVFDHPWYQITSTSGRFKLADVPPGMYDLEMVHPAGGLTWRKRVEIKPGETLNVDIRVSPDDKR
jgi:plastocyanin